MSESVSSKRIPDKWDVNEQIKLNNSNTKIRRNIMGLFDRLTTGIKSSETIEDSTGGHNVASTTFDGWQQLHKASKAQYFDEKDAVIKELDAQEAQQKLEATKRYYSALQKENEAVVSVVKEHAGHIKSSNQQHLVIQGEKAMVKNALNQGAVQEGLIMAKLNQSNEVAVNQLSAIEQRKARMLKV